MENNNNDRRSFLKKAGLMIGVGLSAGTITSILSSCDEEQFFYAPLPETYELSLANYPALANVGTAVKVTIPGKNGGKPLMIKRKAADTFVVLSSICAHQGCEVDLPTGGGLNCQCPCHDVAYSIDDGSITKNGISSSWSGKPLAKYDCTYVSSSNVLKIIL